jgi:unsaturated chondroitin disaccharide hydrolase
MKGFSIIDTMLNLPLLYFASREIGDERFTRVAKRHADMVARDHVRDDGSLCHIVNHNTERPGVIETLAGQGYAVGSSWSRGVSWAVYGFILAYIHTGKDLYLEVAKKTARHFIEETEKTSWLPRLDFSQPEEPMYYDSSAGAITACGLIEIARALPECEGEYYMDAAIKILRTMEEKWCDYTEGEDGILTMASEAYTEGRLKHLPIIYGDFFFVEALLKLKDPDFLVW